VPYTGYWNRDGNAGGNMSLLNNIMPVLVLVYREEKMNIPECLIIFICKSIALYPVN
jgi:hypothetical protein